MLKDFLPKKPNKEQMVKLEEQAKFEEDSKAFIQELDALQKKHDRAIATVLEITENGVMPKFKIVPYPKEQPKTDLVK